MTVTRITLAIVSGLTFSGLASAAPEDAPVQIGAPAVVCRDQNQTITSAELLDLYEARVQYGRTLTAFDPAKDYHAIAHEVAANIDRGDIFFPPIYEPIFKDGGRRVLLRRSSDRLLQIAVDMFQENRNQNTILPGGVGLKPFADYHTLLVPGQCAIEQAAISIGENASSYFSGDIWNHFDAINKAALVVHEGLHWAMHVGGYNTSDRVRRIVGLAFSGFQFQELTEGIPDQSTYCFSEGDKPLYQLGAYMGDNGKAVMQFFTFNGVASATKTTITIDPQSTPLADTHKRVQGVYGKHWDQPTDVELRTILEPKITPKNKFEFWIGEDTIGGDDFQHLAKLKCVPATFDPDQSKQSAQPPGR